MRTLKIMLSSTYTDLKDFRLETLRLLENLSHNIQAMEFFYAKSNKPLEVCLNETRKCDIFICLVAWKYGTIDEESGKSYTQLEYEEAYRRQIPCLIFLLKEDIEWPVRFVDREEQSKKLQDFRRILEKNHTCHYFDNPRDLAFDTITSLKEYLPELVNEKLIKNAYWEKLDLIYKLRDPNARDVVPAFDASKSDLELIISLEKNIKSLNNFFEMINCSYDRLDSDLKDFLKSQNFDVKKLEDVPYYENPFFNRDWELRNLGFHNIVLYLKGNILQLKVKNLERAVLNNPSSEKIKNELKKEKIKLSKFYENTYTAD